MRTGLQESERAERLISGLIFGNICKKTVIAFCGLSADLLILFKSVNNFYIFEGEQSNNRRKQKMWTLQRINTTFNVQCTGCIRLAEQCQYQ